MAKKNSKPTPKRSLTVTIILDAEETAAEIIGDLSEQYAVGSFNYQEWESYE